MLLFSTKKVPLTLKEHMRQENKHLQVLMAYEALNNGILTRTSRNEVPKGPVFKWGGGPKRPGDLLRVIGRADI